MMYRVIINLIILHTLIFSANTESTDIYNDYVEGSSGRLGRIGDYGYPTNPTYDRALGFLLQGKVKNAVSNHGNFVTWAYHPAGFWGEYGYLPHLSFVAGIPGHAYSSEWSKPGDDAWELDGNGIWSSSIIYKAWMEDITDIENDKNNFKTIVYNTVVDYGDGNKGHNDKGKIALEIIDYCTNALGQNINTEIFGNETPNKEDCESASNTWKVATIDDIDLDGGAQWLLDHESAILYLYLSDPALNPNDARSGIGLAYPWSIRPKFASRTITSSGFYFDQYDYGLDLEEWTADDNYTYYGATFAESWFIDDTGYRQPKIKTDWQATNGARYNTHNSYNTVGDLFGSTEWTDPDDPDKVLAHSKFPSTWPEKYSFDSGEFEPFWPGWWADEYYGDSPNLWSSLGIYDCEQKRSDPGCWKPLHGRHVSDMDIYMEFDDRWANVGNRVIDNEYISTGYPMALKVMSIAHSYGVAYAEDIMFVTVKVRNESGDFCAFEKDKNGLELPVYDSNDMPICGDGMIMPDGTKLNRGKGFNYKKLYLGFYMDADVLSSDMNNGGTVHTPADDFMKYIDCEHSDSREYYPITEEYPTGCPIVNEDTLRISMAVIGDYDGGSNSALGYSMETNKTKGPDFGVVAVQLLDSPYSTDYVDLDQDGFFNLEPGDKLKMTDWHWFDWMGRPGVLNAEQIGDTPAQNKELIQYQVIAGDNTNLTNSERVRFFHTEDPATDDEVGYGKPHFDSLKGLKETSFFESGDDGLDCVLEMSSGPFGLEVGEEVAFSFSVIMGQNIDDLLQNAYFAQIMYNSHYQGYTPPLIPNVMAIPSHNKVELYWDSLSVSSNDVITGYADFEGYKIYRSIDGGNTWGSVEDEIIISDASEGWQPLGLGCFDNPDDTDHLSSCPSIGYSQSCSTVDSDSDNISDCIWKVAQFDLSSDADKEFCIYGKVDPLDDSKGCITTSDCLSPCVRGVDVQGQDPVASWFHLGYDTGLEAILIDPENPDSVLTVLDETSGETHHYKYKFVDDTVIDGIEYVYSVVAYDRGVPPELITYASHDTDSTFVQQVESVPDPDGWGKINEFKILESPKGATVYDNNFVKVVPGYMPTDNIENVMVVPNPYIVHSGFNETEYKKRIRFTHLPSVCTITIFTISGEKVRELSHNDSKTGNMWWDLRSYNNQEIAPGLYIYTVEAPGIKEPQIGKFAVVR